MLQTNHVKIQCYDLRFTLITLSILTYDLLTIFVLNSWAVLWLVWGGLCTKSPQSRQEIPCTTIQFHLKIYRWCIVSEKNTRFAEYLDFIYPHELEIKKTTETAASSSYLDCCLYIDNRKLTTRLYDKRDDFNFPIVNFPFLSSNIPSAPAYGVYLSQLIRYARACSNYRDFIERGKELTAKLLSPGYQKIKTGSNTKEVPSRKHIYIILTPLNPTFI